MRLGKSMFSTSKIPHSLNKECFYLWFEYGTLKKAAIEFFKRHPEIKASTKTMRRAAALYVLENPDEVFDLYKQNGMVASRDDFDAFRVKLAVMYYPDSVGFERASRYILYYGLEKFLPMVEENRPGFSNFYRKFKSKMVGNDNALQ